MKSFVSRAADIIDRSCEAWADWRSLSEEEQDEARDELWAIYELGKQEGLAQALERSAGHAKGGGDVD